MSLPRRLLLAITSVIAMLTTATAWYNLVEGFPLLDALYMSVTTITTVGFREVQPLDTSGKLFTIAYVLGGIGLVFYTAFTIVEAVLVGDIAEALGLRRMSRRVGRMRDHFVVCGYGRVGQEIAHHLRARGVAVLVVDRDPGKRDGAIAAGCSVVIGDATEESVLQQAGVERARVLIAAADSDAGNTFVTLTARALNPELSIVARAGSESAGQRLRTAGASRVISPYQIAGRWMALAAIQPLVLDFLEVVPDRPADQPRLLAEVVVADRAAALADRTIGEAFAALRATRVLGIERADGEVVVGPSADTVLRTGDRLMLYGERREIEALSAEPRRPTARGTEPAATPAS